MQRKLDEATEAIELERQVCKNHLKTRQHMIDEGLHPSSMHEEHGELLSYTCLLVEFFRISNKFHFSGGILIFAVAKLLLVR